MGPVKDGAETEEGTLEIGMGKLGLWQSEVSSVWFVHCSRKYQPSLFSFFSHAPSVVCCFCF